MKFPGFEKKKKKIIDQINRDQIKIQKKIILCITVEKHVSQEFFSAIMLN